MDGFIQKRLSMAHMVVTLRDDLHHAMPEAGPGLRLAPCSWDSQLSEPGAEYASIHQLPGPSLSVLE